jgi:hypothetical protein
MVAEEVEFLEMLEAEARSARRVDLDRARDAECIRIVGPPQARQAQAAALLLPVGPVPPAARPLLSGERTAPRLRSTRRAKPR